MLRAIAGAKWLVSVSIIAVVIVIGVVALTVKTATHSTTSYCAVMSDAVGLFKGNDVTRRGVKVGTITGVGASGSATTVRFSINAGEKLPANVGAVSVSPSILAVRSLSLMGDYNGGATLPADSCIGRGRTRTPVTIAKSLQSISDLSKQLTTDGGPQQLAQVLKSVGTLDHELQGTGPAINALVKQLATPGVSPLNSGLVNVGSVIDNLSSLTGGLADNMPLFTQFIGNSAALGEGGTASLFLLVERLLKSLPETLKAIGEPLSRYQQFIFPALDVVVPAARLIGAGFRDFGDLLGIVPPLIRAFSVQQDPNTLGFRIHYTPPSTLIPAANPRFTCANINRIAPGQCSVVDDHTMKVDAISLALRAIGAAR